MKFLNSKYSVVLTGLILGLAFPPLPTFFLAFFAFIPFLIGIDKYVADSNNYPEQVGNKKSKKPSFAGFFKAAYLTFFVYHGITNWWISSWRSNTDPFLMISGLATWLAHPIFFMLGVYIYFKVRQNFGKYHSLILFPFIWVAYEWFFSLGELSYPWLAIGNTQIYNHYWIQIVDITGVWGASFLVALSSSLLTAIYFRYKESKASTDTSDISDFAKKQIPKLITLLILIQILPNIYGYFRLQDFEHKELMQNNKQIRVAVVQPNIDPWGKWGRNKQIQLNTHKRLQDSISSVVDNIDLSVWSETALTRFSLDFNRDLDFYLFDRWADKLDISLLSGFVHSYVYKEGEARQVTARQSHRDTSQFTENFNSALLYNPGQSIENRQIYHKSKLTPFAERVPRVEFFAFMMKWVKWGVGIQFWGLGAGPKNLVYNRNGEKFKIAPIICIESIYPDFCRQFTAQGAEILTVITNDAWYDFTAGPEQHFQIACMRAIENRRYLARCANTGVSGFISPQGVALSRAEHYKDVAAYDDLPRLTAKSLYVKYGDWLAEICAMVSLMLIGFMIFTRYFTKK